MKIFLILLGIFWIVAGVMLFMLVDTSKELLHKMMKQKNIKLFSSLPLIIGILLILGSPLVSAPWFAVILGILGISKGLFFIFGPEKKTRPLIDWCLNASNGVYRSWGVASFLLGVLFLLLL